MDSANLNQIVRERVFTIVSVLLVVVSAQSPVPGAEPISDSELEQYRGGCLYIDYYCRYTGFNCPDFVPVGCPDPVAKCRFCIGKQSIACWFGTSDTEDLDCITGSSECPNRQVYVGPGIARLYGYCVYGECEPEAKRPGTYPSCTDYSYYTCSD